MVDAQVRIAREVCEAGDQTQGRGRAGAVVFGTVFGRGDGVPRFGDGVDLRDDD